MCKSITKEFDGDFKKDYPKGSVYNLSCKQTAIVKFVEYDSEKDITIVRLVK